MVDRVPPSLPDRELRKALKFALGMAHLAPREGGPEVPSGLRTFLLAHRDLRDTDLARVRGLLEEAGTFREWVGVRSNVEICGEAGHLWLSRPEGWLERVGGSTASAPDTGGEGGAAERRRREAAESKLAQLRTEADALRSTVATQAAEISSLRERLATEERRSAAADRLADERASTARRGSGERDKAVARAEAAEAELDALRHRLAEAEAARDALLADAASSWAESAEVHRVRSLLAEAHGVLEALVAVPSTGRQGARRAPQAIPGSAYGDDLATLQHLLRVPGIHVVVDGYNVAKLGWPSLSLVQQRDRCIEATEGMASRFGTRIHVVFDGATIPGASTTARRLVRVSYSPAGVSADDVIRHEVAALDPSIPVAVVTNDRAIVRDVKAMGANTVPSDAAVALARR